MDHTFLSFANDVEQNRLIVSFTKRLEIRLGLAQLGKEPLPLLGIFEQLAGEYEDNGEVNAVTQLLDATRDYTSLKQDALILIESREARVDARIKALPATSDPRSVNPVSTRQVLLLGQTKQQLKHARGLWRRDSADEGDLLVAAMDKVNFANQHYRNTLRLAMLVKEREPSAVAFRKALQLLLATHGVEQHL